MQLQIWDQKILVFLMIPLYTAVLSTEEYGISDMVQTTAQMLFPILTCMIADAILRFCFIKNVDRRKLFSTGLRVTLWGFCNKPFYYSWALFPSNVRFYWWVYSICSYYVMQSRFDEPDA